MSEQKTNAVSGFDGLGLSAFMLEALKRLKLENPTPIQRKAIPVAMSDQDMVGVAQTGTGKTFAFGIPMIERLKVNGGKGLIILPTRELALQVNESLIKLGGGFGARSLTLIGGEPIMKQIHAIKRNPDIVVATPGRLIDHLKRKTIRLDRVKILVLDEADMMFDMGFAPQLKEILEQVPKDRQTLLFSATMPATIMKLATNHMKLPISIEAAPQGTTAETVDQEIYVVRKEEKITHLANILKEFAGSILIFTRTKHGAKNLTRVLAAKGELAIEIHSNLSLSQRRKALDGFKSKKFRIMVGTDIAARGIDVTGIELVVNYDLPDSTEDYVHRIGRTGRAGKTGKAISLATPDQAREIVKIERLINKTLPKKKFAQLDQAVNHARSFGPRSNFGRPRRPQPRGFGRRPGGPGQRMTSR